MHYKVLVCIAIFLLTLNLLFQAIWPYSGHYHPTEENFMEFISFLQDNHVDLTNVKVNVLIVFLYDNNVQISSLKNDAAVLRRLVNKFW